MTDHYAHVDTGEKPAVAEGMLRVIQGGGGGKGSPAGEQKQTGSGTDSSGEQEHLRNIAPENRNILLGQAIPGMQKARFPRRTRAFSVSGRRDLNPRRPPWQGGTLPLSYSREVGG